jgi:hypothetical protein
MSHNTAGSRRTSRYTLQEPPPEDEQRRVFLWFFELAVPAWCEISMSLALEKA